jgi:hypothetical protein
MSASPNGLSRFVAVAALLAASGCLVSETPLFDAGNARSKPLKAGRYSVCSYSSDAPDDSECNPADVSVDRSGLYKLTVEDDVVEARFRKVARGAWAAQFAEDGEESHYYFGARKDGVFTLTMMWCENLPEELRNDLVDRGDLVVENDNKVCNISDARAVVAAARAYARGDVAGDSIYMTFLPENATE